jgi:hypothetical protein
MRWIKVSDELPPENKYILAIHNRGTWLDSDDQEHVNCVVVKMVKGISMEERDLLDGTDPRKREYWIGDEQSNNLVPYIFSGFGPGSFFGQQITHWMPLPEPPNDI